MPSRENSSSAAATRRSRAGTGDVRGGVTAPHYNDRSARTLVLVAENDRSTLRLVAAGTALVGATYGLGRYAYGLYLPVLRSEFGLGASAAGALAAGAYASYFVPLFASAPLAGRAPPPAPRGAPPAR